ncbi:MAG: DUF3575 domain-containing protein [Muribaculaceae bacterium]|nr:DUF3575 domain-containing protein [Muribaculaceae bacterium]
MTFKATYVSRLIAQCFIVCIGMAALCAFPTLDVDAAPLLHLDSISPASRSLTVTPPSLAAPKPVSTALRPLSAPDTIPPARLRAALRSNLLFDLLAVPNVAAEVYLGRNMSVALQWMYAWWRDRSRNRFWRIYGGDVAWRYWFGRHPRGGVMSGHHAGVYAGAFTFNFEWGSTGWIGGRPGGNLWDRCMLNIGLEYGYTLPLSRRLSIDFTVGAGCIRGVMEKYEPENGHYYWQSTQRRTWFGPTKAEISLVWFPGRGNGNIRKGGARP